MTNAIRKLAVLAGIMVIAGCAATRTQQAPGEYVDDSAVTANVKSALISDPATKAYKIEVETFRGVVQLSGFVDSSSERQTAARVAQGVRGVKSVQNNLAVGTDENTAGEVLDDTVITGKVMAALIGNPVTKARQINVDTAGGVVHLSGFADSKNEKTAATDVARSVSGVRSVRNELAIRQGP